MRIAVTLILCLALLAGCSSSYADIIEANWDIDLPRDYAEKYAADSGASFHGDGFRYHVFHYDDGNAVNSMFDWSTDQSRTYAKWTMEWSEQWGVPIETDADLSQFPSWSKKRHDNSTLILFWDDEGGCLYIVEDLI